MQEVLVRGLATLDTDFPEPVVGSRRSRTQDEKDFWAARRVLQVLYRSKAIDGACRLRRIPESNICRTPDFELLTSRGPELLEITEATHPLDQRELTLSERRTGPILMGALGGRGEDGFVGDEPEQMALRDIAEAIHRKSVHYPSKLTQTMVLGVYLNSNPGFHVASLSALRDRIVKSAESAKSFAQIVLFKDNDAGLVLHR